MIVAIEGIDGAGKNTLTTALAAELRGRGVDVDTLSFPAYGRTRWADRAADALHGRIPGLVEDPRAMAELFARDRLQLAPEIRRRAAESDVLIVDRYVASNAAFTLARLGLGVDPDPAEEVPEVLRWLAELELGPGGVPQADVTVLLDATVDLAARRARGRESADPGRARDTYERDADLQARVARAYRALAARGWTTVDAAGRPDAPTRWAVVPADRGADLVAAELAATILGQLAARPAVAPDD